MSSLQQIPTFLFVGNGSYMNRGCEAIARGTTHILRRAFGEAKFISVNFGEVPNANRNNSEIVHHAISIGRYSRTWFVQNTLRAIGMQKTWFPVVGQYIDDADAVLALGGDNYSMDYGSLRAHLAMIDYSAQHNQPFVIWGGSVGPFKKHGAEYEQYVAKKLKKVTAILARESATVDYLAQLGLIDNVHQVADPAFVMEPAEPPAGSIPFEALDGAIGFNFSPLMARYLTGGDVAACTALVVELVQNILDTFDVPVILIPHAQKSISDDFIFLADVAGSFISRGAPVHLLPRTFSAPEIKWVVGKLRCFAGARTHSTIAAISAGVPTLSFSYSIKSIGINRDVFGHEDYVMVPGNFSPKRVSHVVGDLVREDKTIRRHLDEQLPLVKQRAFDAGDYLKAYMKKSQSK